VGFFDERASQKKSQEKPRLHPQKWDRVSSNDEKTVIKAAKSKARYARRLTEEEGYPVMTRKTNQNWSRKQILHKRKQHSQRQTGIEYPRQALTNCYTWSKTPSPSSDQQHLDGRCMFS